MTATVPQNHLPPLGNVTEDSDQSASRLGILADLVCIIILTAAVLCCFWPVMHAGFTNWDDWRWIGKNPALNPPQSPLDFWSKPFADIYVPVTFMLWALMAKFDFAPYSTLGRGLNPHVFHALNVSVHAVTVILVYLLLRRLIRSRWPALLGAILFAVHPLQVEGVAWVAGLKDVLSALLAAAALLCLLPAMDGRPLSIKEEKTEQRDENPDRAIDFSTIRRGWYASATACGVLAMLAKPSAVVLPLLGFVIVLFYRLRTEQSGQGWRRESRSAALLMLPWLVCAAIVAGVSAHFQAARGVIAGPAYFRPVVALDALSFYIQKLFAPIGLVPDYGRNPVWLMGSTQRFWTWVIPVLIAAVALIFRGRLPALLTGFMILVACLLPVLGFVAFDFQSYSTVADHYFYLAMLGPALVLAAVAARWIEPVMMGLSLPIALALAVGLGMLSYRQAGYWKSDETLFTHNLAVNPDSLASYSDLGLTYVAERQWLKASKAFNNDLQLHPDDLQTHFDYGLLLDRFGHLKEAIYEYKLALGRENGLQLPTATLAGVYSNLGAAETRLGEVDTAMGDFQMAIKLDPTNSSWHVNMARLLVEINQPAAAFSQLQEALRLDPKNANASELLESLGGAPPALLPQ